MNQKYSFPNRKASLSSSNLLSNKILPLRSFAKGTGIINGLPPFHDQSFPILVLQIGFYKALKITIEYSKKYDYSDCLLVTSFLLLE